MNDLFHRNYKATIKRGLINNRTTLKDYIIKLKEEVKELEYSINEADNTFDSYELVDCFLVCASALLDLRLMHKVEEKVLINEKRAAEVMDIATDNNILYNHNKWRRGEDGYVETNPTRLGVAIDTILNHLNEK